MSYDPFAELRKYKPTTVPVLSTSPLSIHSGWWVKLLCRLLAETGHWLQPEPSDDFNKTVENAVKQFQRDNGLSADGIVGPKTWAKFREIGAGRGSLPSEVPLSPASEQQSGKNEYRRISLAGRKLIEKFEGRRNTVYLDPVNLPTVGIGHLLSAAENKRWPVGTKLSDDQVDRLFAADIKRFEIAVEKAVTVPMDDGMFAACVSLAYNVGVGAFRKSSVCKRLNAGDKSGAAAAFGFYNKAKGQVLAGLTKRRSAERELFLSGE